MERTSEGTEYLASDRRDSANRQCFERGGAEGIYNSVQSVGSLAMLAVFGSHENEARCYLIQTWNMDLFEVGHFVCDECI